MFVTVKNEFLGFKKRFGWTSRRLLVSSGVAEGSTEGDCGCAGDD
jgi:hypothetical protein